MTSRRLIIRNIFHFWRQNLAVVAGVATAVAVLSGALIVGESVRASLRDLVLARLGQTDYVVSSDHFFRETLAEQLQSREGFDRHFVATSPIVYLRGILIHERSGLRAHNVDVYGVDDRFWRFHMLAQLSGPEGRNAFLGEGLAAELSASPGDTVLLRLEKQDGVPKESVFGQREDTGRTIRLQCERVLSGSELGEYSLEPSQGQVSAIFVPLARLQRDLDQPASANMILASAADPSDKSAILKESLQAGFDLQDIGIRFRQSERGRAVYVESRSVLLDDSIATAAQHSASKARLRSSVVFTYLANSIHFQDRTIPYSVITAADLDQSSFRDVNLLAGKLDRSSTNTIWLSEWAANDLGAEVGEEVSIDYFMWLPEGRLVTQSAGFTVGGVLALEGELADPFLAPDFPGITEAASVGDWDPPFPLDLDRIRPADEQFWDDYRTTPKAFVPLSEGQKLWSTRFGRVSSVRLSAEPGVDLDSALAEFELDLRSGLKAEQSGFGVQSVRAERLEASEGSTDFGEYFVYFSFFLISAAVLLAALFFRLGLEQRAREIGTLRATGYNNSQVRNLFLAEGSLLALSGSIAGTLAALGYGWLLLYGLRSWWVEAVGTRQLFLHPSGAAMAIGALTGVAAALFSVALTLRGLHRSSPRALLAGSLESRSVRTQKTARLKLIAIATLAVASLLFASAIFGFVSQEVGFFGAGSFFLIAFLSFLALRLRAEPRRPLGTQRGALLLFGARNAGYRPGRAILCVALIASATFLIVSIESFRKDPSKVSLEPASGTGGFSLLAESVIPILHDLNDPEGLQALSLSPVEASALSAASFASFRLRPGEDSSCLNLYKPRNPRILGVPPAIVSGGRFSFRDSVGGTAEQEANPWRLLDHSFESGAIPAIGDANTLQYILHLGLGDEFVLKRGTGDPVRLHIVASLHDSIFQGELLISELNFLELFSEQQGYGFVLIEAEAETSSAIAQVLEEGLADFGIDVASTSDRLAAFHRVENTYLSTFQSLGGLGLILGTIGLATVLLRNVLERRHELALLRAVGYQRRDLLTLVLAENAYLLVLGLLCGTICAAVAILPAISSRGGILPFGSIGVLLVLVFVVGLTASLLAAVAAFRAPLLQALRAE